MNNTVAAGGAVRQGDRVRGQYHGVPFRGTVTYRRWHTVNHDELVVHVDLEEKIEVFGSERGAICLHPLWDTGRERSNDGCWLALTDDSATEGA